MRAGLISFQVLAYLLAHSSSYFFWVLMFANYEVVFLLFMNLDI